MLALLFAILLAPDLADNNIAKYAAENFFTYSGRQVTVSWCWEGTAESYDFEIYNVEGAYNEVSEIGLTATSYVWTVPRAGAYTMRVRARLPDGSMTPWAESDTVGEQPASTCGTPRSFILNALIAPPTGGFEP